MLKLVALALLGVAVAREPEMMREETYGEYATRMGHIGDHGNWQGVLYDQFKDMPLSVLRKTRLGTKLDYQTRNPPMKPDHLYAEEEGMDTPYNSNWAISSNSAWNSVCGPTFMFIKDQADCGSCWAVSASSVAEDRSCIANMNALGQGFGRVSLSAENLMSCCDWCGQGCEGGYPIDAMRYWCWNKLPTGGQYASHCGCQPYMIPPCPPSGCSGPLAQTPGCSSSCRNGYFYKTVSQDGHACSDAYMIPFNVKKLQDEIYKRGSIECAYTVHTNFFSYGGGVYDNCGGPIDGGHAVTLMGWGTLHGTPFWLVKNSWNSTWGVHCDFSGVRTPGTHQNGCFLIKRGVNLCGIEEQCVAGTAKVNSNHLALSC